MTSPLFELAPQAPPAQSGLTAPGLRLGKRFIEIPGRDQMSFEVRKIDDFVREDDPVRAVDGIMDLVDFSTLEAAHPGGGRPGFPPRFMAKLLFFGYSNGIRSAREISGRLDHDLRFMWLACGVQVDHQRLSEFRRNFLKPLKDIFKQTVRLGMCAGLVRLNLVSIDGTKIAAAARKRAYNNDQLDEALRELDEQIDKLMAEAEATDAAEDQEFGDARGDELPGDLQAAQQRREKLLAAQKALAESDQKQVSVTDPEAPLQKIGGSKRAGYNGQLAVDGETGMVVAEELTTAENDTQQFEPMVDQVAENTGLLPDVAPADSGYHSKETLEFIESSGVNGYIKQSLPKAGKRYGHDDFEYDQDSDSYRCPGGRVLEFKCTKTLRDTDGRLYRARGRHCKECPYRDRCITEKARYRDLFISPHEQLLVGMRRKIATDEGKHALQRRKETVEPTFGTIKAVLGLRQFLLRGLEGAQIEFGLCAIAINIRKLAKWLVESGELGRLKLALAAG